MPVSIARLRELLELAGTAGVESIDLIEGGTRIRITRSGDAPLSRLPAPMLRPDVSAAPMVDDDILVSPMFGVVHLTPAPDAKPYIQVGDPVTKGQQLCLIEAMKMFSAVRSDRDGRMDAILVETGVEVANGQPLFRIAGA